MTGGGLARIDGRPRLVEGLAMPTKSGLIFPTTIR